MVSEDNIEGYLYVCENCLIVSVFKTYEGLHRVLECPVCKTLMMHEYITIMSRDTTIPLEGG